MATDAPSISLSRRERQVLALVAEGLADKEIGAQLGISRGTVKHYLTLARLKLRCRNRTEAAVRALSCGLLRKEEL